MTGVQTCALPISNSRIRTAQLERSKDIDAWECREALQTAWGAFHALMNLIWLLLHIHRGSLEELGSLTWFFNIMDKTRLSGEKPDFHTLLSALEQVFASIILNGWRHESGSSTLQEYAQSRPGPDEILATAAQVIKNHAIPVSPVHEDDIKKGTTERKPDDNIPYHNLRVLACDLLYVCELTRATADGDFGRIEDTLR